MRTDVRCSWLRPSPDRTRIRPLLDCRRRWRTHRKRQCIQLQTNQADNLTDTNAYIASPPKVQHCLTHVALEPTVAGFATAESRRNIAVGVVLAFALSSAEMTIVSIFASYSPKKIGSRAQTLCLSAYRFRNRDRSSRANSSKVQCADRTFRHFDTSTRASSRLRRYYSCNLNTYEN